MGGGADIVVPRPIRAKTSNLEKSLGFSEASYVERAEENPGVYTLKKVAKADQTYDLVMEAVKADGLALGQASKKLITPEVCLAAVAQNGASLGYVPPKLMKDESLKKELVETAFNSSPAGALRYIEPESITKDMCIQAVKQDGRAIEDVPECYLSKDLILLAVQVGCPVEERSTWSRSVLRRLDSKYQDKEIVLAALERDPNEVEYTAPKYLTKKVCIDLVERNPDAYRCLTESKRKDSGIIAAAVAADPKNVRSVPVEFQTADMWEAWAREDISAFAVLPEWCREEVLSRFENVEIWPIGGEDEECFYAKRDGEVFKLHRFSSCAASATKLSPLTEVDSAARSRCALVPVRLASGIVDPVEQVREITAAKSGFALIDLTREGGSNLNSKFYYVSDIHIEHQLDLSGLTETEIQACLRRKIEEMLEEIDDARMSGTLMIAGDVSCAPRLVEIFLRELSAKWRGQILCVLGNHELWDWMVDGSHHAIGADYPEEILAYFDEYCPRKVRYLENELLIDYKRGWDSERILDEELILGVDDDELRGLLEKSTRIVLGGTGYSALNEEFNADAGLYRGMVDREEETERSARFKALHDKLARCAKDLSVIVLSHMPFENWSDGERVPGWIYVSGHTHKNLFSSEEGAAIVLADNQFGYSPRKWALKGFVLDGSYDPFSDWADGSYVVTREEYEDYNSGQGISCQGCRWAGEIVMLKRCGYYMFFLSTQTGLSILDGGRRCKTEHSLKYFYENMVAYAETVEAEFRPYRATQEIIASEVRAFGGYGRVHGCIIDIDFFNHIYLNPFDGTVSYYFATDMANKIFYRSVKALLKDYAKISLGDTGTSLLKSYEAKDKGGSLPILGSKKKKKSAEVAIQNAVVSELVLDKTMYEPSKVMMKIQYALDKRVIRVWNDRVLEEVGENLALLE